MRSNQNLRVSWKPLNRQDCVRKNFSTELPEDHIGGRGDNSLQHYNLVHKFIPMPHAIKIPAAKAAVDKEWDKLEKIPAWDLTNSEVKKRWSMQQGRRAQKFISPHWWTSVIRKMPTWRQSTKNTKVELCSEAALWKMIPVLMQSFTEQGSSASQMTAAKVMKG